jgi:putative adhesin
MKTTFVSALILAALGAAGCDVRVNDKGVSIDINEGGRAEDESTQSYPLSKGGRIELEANNGQVELIRAAGTAVEVHARRQVRAKSDEEAKALLKQQYFTIEAAPDRVTIRAVKQDGLEGMRRRVRTDYRISVPVGAIVSIRNENGGVNLKDTDARVTIGSTNGQIEGHGVSGGLDVETVNGPVTMQMAAVTSDVRIRTVNGGVTLGLPKGINAMLEATTVNGGVMVHDTLPLEATTRERQRLSAKLGTGSGPRIDLQTINGGVRLGGGEPPR